MTISKHTLSSRGFPVLVALLTFAVISPALWSGWSGDDAFYSVLNGILGADRLTLWDAMGRSFSLWFNNNGRFYPGLIVEKYLVFHFFTNLLAYKVFLVGMTLVTVELFRRCAAAYSNEAVGNLCALVVLVLFQERGYQDAILAYNAMPQVVAIALLCSLLSYERALSGARRGAAITAILCYAAAALTYEDAYGFALLYPILALARVKSLRVALRLGAPYLIVSAALITFSLIARSIAKVPPDSLYGIHLSPAIVARTALEQWIAAFPLSYWLLDPSGIYDRSSIAAFLRNAPINPILLIILFVVARIAVRDALQKGGNSSALIGLGTLITLVAALPVAILTKYQHELKLGLGYLPVFFEVFGIALVIVGLALRWSTGTPSKALVTACAAAIALVGAMTQATNTRLVREGIPSLLARTALERELDRGLASALPNGSTIAIATPFDWIDYDDDGPDGISTRGMFYLHGRKRVRLVASSAGTRADATLRYDTHSHRWLLTRLPRTSSP